MPVLRCLECGYTVPVFEGWKHCAGSACSGVQGEGLLGALLHTWELVEDEDEDEPYGTSDSTSGGEQHA